MSQNNILQNMDFSQWFEQHIPGITWHGDEGQGRCPLPTHGGPDKKPSISLNTTKGIWYCHTEGVGGGINDLAARLGVDSPFQSKESASFIMSPQLTIEALATDKGFPVDFLISLGVSQDNNHVKISYLLEDGSPAPRQRIRRALRAKDGSLWAKGDGSPTLYGLWKLDDARDKGLCVFVEGESDCWTLWYHGFPALGFPGASMTEKLRIKHIEGLSKIYVIREPDKGGDTFVGGLTRQFGSWKAWQGELFEVRLSELTGAKDPNDLHKQNPDGFKEAFKAAMDAAKPLELPESSTDAKVRKMKTGGSPTGLNHTDLGNAQRLVNRHGKDLRFCHPWGKWLVWDDSRWRIDDTGAVLRLAKETVRSIYAEAAAESDERAREAIADHAMRSESASRIRAMVALAESESGIPVLPAELDCDPWLLNCLNGTVDLRTGELCPHRRDDLITKLAPVNYDPVAECPLWMKFLNEIMNNNQNLIGFLCRGVGQSLTGDVSEHILYIPYGSGRNGKSTFLNTIMVAVGDYAMTAPPDLLMAKKNDQHPTELADLFGKRFVAAIESDQGRRLAEGLVKQLTGGDKIKARRMREDFWQFDPTHKLWFATNHRPRVHGTDVAIWSRIKLIPFEVQFPDGDPRQDKKLPEKLKTELPGILRWAVEGCLAWQREGLGVPHEVRMATDAYRQEQDTLAGFLTDCCIINPLARTTAGSLYKEYVNWCTINGEHPVVQRNFGMQLAERGFVSQKGRGGQRFWHGVGLCENSVVAQVADGGTISSINKNIPTREGTIGKIVPLTPPAPLNQNPQDLLSKNHETGTIVGFASLPEESESEDWEDDRRW